MKDINIQAVRNLFPTYSEAALTFPRNLPRWGVLWPGDLSPGIRSSGMKSHTYAYRGKAPIPLICQGINPSPIGAAKAAEFLKESTTKTTAKLPLHSPGICPVGAFYRLGIYPQASDYPG